MQRYDAEAAKPCDKEAPLRLDPMRDVPPDVGICLTRVANGSLAVALAMLVGFLHFSMDKWTVTLMLRIGYLFDLAVTIAYAVGVWLLTSSELRSRADLTVLRAGARIGACSDVICSGMCVAVTLGTGIPRVILYGLPLVSLVGRGGLIAEAWYVARLYRRVPRKGLGATFGLLKWLGVIGLLVTCLLALAVFLDAPRGTWPPFSSDLKGPSLLRSICLDLFTFFTMVFFAFSVWAHWWLYYVLRWDLEEEGLSVWSAGPTRSVHYWMRIKWKLALLVPIILVLLIMAMIFAKVYHLVSDHYVQVPF